MISLSGVNKRLGSFRLKDISIEIPDRYICALVGQNASGKTTLIKMILGLCRPDEGTVVIDGLNYQEAENKYRIISGESYKVKLLKQEDIIHVEDRKYGTKALVVNHGYSKYDGALTVTVPTLEEFMYHYSKRGESVI